MKKKHSSKRRNTKASNSLTKRVPPSVPKCVKPSPQHGGYITDYVTANGVNVQFLFKKIQNGYDVYIRNASSVNWRCIKSDITFSPSARSHFETQATLSKAIAAVESWINAPLPDIR